MIKLEYIKSYGKIIFSICQEPLVTDWWNVMCETHRLVVLEHVRNFPPVETISAFQLLTID